MKQNVLTSSLDMFLLALIAARVNTAYGMREQAATSLGATLPALKRLEGLGLIKRGEMAARKKVPFELTNKGCSALESSWAEFIRKFVTQMPRETEAILRIAALANARGKKADAKRLLKRAAADRRRRVLELRKQMKTMAAATELGPIYRSMLITCDAAHFQAECKALRKLASAGERTHNLSRRRS